MRLLRDRLDLWYRDGMLINDNRTSAEKDLDMKVLTNPEQFSYRKPGNKHFEDYKRVKQAAIQYLISIDMYPDIMGLHVKDFLTDLIVDKLWNVRVKGCCIIGGWGCGKTEALKIISRRFEMKFIKMVDFTALVENVLAENNSKVPVEFWDDWMNTDLILDDVGKETKILYYGKEIELASVFIDKRHQAYMQTGVQTFITTNESEEALEARYDKTLSRIYEMAEVRTLIGPDMRKVGAV